MAEFRRFLQKKTTGFIATPDDRAMARPKRAGAVPIAFPLR
jgi:hypothetical protein